MKDFDHIIVGAGLIGLITALALAQLQPTKSIVLLEAGAPAGLSRANNSIPAEANLDTRTLALNANSIDYLVSLGLWDKLIDHACPIQQVHISEQGAFGSCLLTAAEVQAAFLGQVLEIATLHKILFTQLKNYPHISHYQQAQVLNLTPQLAGWQLTVSQAESTDNFAGKYVVLVDGTHSKLREKLAIRCRTLDYQQTAIVAAVRSTVAHHNIAYERFAKDKILAVLPLTENRIGTVLTTSQATAEKLLQLDEQTYLAELQSLLHYRLGSLVAVGPRQSYPLRQVIAEQFVLNNLVLLGNTAHTLNPLGAQGLNLGLAGVRDYVHFISTGQASAEFADRQTKRCAQLKKFTQDCNLIFASHAFATKYARRLALLGLQHCDSIKQRFIRQMMGYV